jgi:hypothetical protein
LIVPLFASLAVLLAAAGEARPATRVVKRLDGSQITHEALTGRIQEPPENHYVPYDQAGAH